MNLYEYKDDTLLPGTRHFLEGAETFDKKYFYNSSSQLILDSSFHRPAGGTSWTGSAVKYINEFDSQGRKIAETQLTGNGDSIVHYVYKFGPANHQETVITNYYYNPFRKTSYLTTIDFTAFGKILSEKTYDNLNQLSSQYDYTYDGNGNLLKIISGVQSGNMWEDRYSNNVLGKPEKIERYYQNKLRSTTFYYYE